MVKESDLVHNLSNGHIVSFNILYKRYSRHLYCFAFGYLKSEVEAEEVVQEVFVKIWERRSLLKHELSFKSFLFTIAFNIIKKNFRTKAYLLKYFMTRDGFDSDIQTTQKIAYDSIRAYVLKLAKMLPDRRKEIFIKSAKYKCQLFLIKYQ